MFPMRLSQLAVIFPFSCSYNVQNIVFFTQHVRSEATLQVSKCGRFAHIQCYILIVGSKTLGTFITFWLADSKLSVHHILTNNHNLLKGCFVYHHWFSEEKNIYTQIYNWWFIHLLVVLQLCKKWTLSFLF